MGLFSSKKTPSLDLSKVRYPSAEELFGSATGFAKRETPLAYGAREGALADLSRGSEYYQSFQPTDFDQALSNQYFANVWPDTEKTIKGTLSQRGLADSTILSKQLGRARGELGYNIGSYLSGLGEQRATNSLNARLGIDPFSTYSPYLETDINQTDKQANLAIQQAMLDYQNALNKYNQRQSKISTIATLGGAALGALTGGLAAPAMSFIGGPLAGMSAGTAGAISGGALGAGLGGAISPLFGGGQSPVNFQDALSISDRYSYKPQSVYSRQEDPYEMLRKYGLILN